MHIRKGYSFTSEKSLLCSEIKFPFKRNACQVYEVKLISSYCQSVYRATNDHFVLFLYIFESKNDTVKSWLCWS